MYQNYESFLKLKFSNDINQAFDRFWRRSFQNNYSSYEICRVIKIVSFSRILESGNLAFSNVERKFVESEVKRNSLYVY